MSTHTPGPWMRCGGATAGYMAIHAGEHGYIVYGLADRLSHTEHGKPIHCPGMDEQHANARLIAAAPDLLEALQYVMSAHGEQLTDAFNQAHRAIAKATGQ